MMLNVEDKLVNFVAITACGFSVLIILCVTSSLIASCCHNYDDDMIAI